MMIGGNEKNNDIENGEKWCKEKGRKKVKR